MATDIDKWIEQLEDHITNAVNEAVLDVAEHATVLMKKQIDPNRRKTQQSVRHRMTGRRSAVVGLFFATEYSGSTGTETHRQFRRVSRLIRPALEKRFIKTLNEKLQGN